MIYGISYYPEQKSGKELEHDLKLLITSGLDFVRMGEFAWCRFEKTIERLNREIGTVFWNQEYNRYLLFNFEKEVNSIRCEKPMKDVLTGKPADRKILLQPKGWTILAG